ncbi:MAG: hypothetical protein QM607_04970 [Microbacterium sp.]
MSTWAEMRIDVVEGVSLDPRNVRLDTPDGVPESDIIQDLFVNEKALNLVEGITKVGLLTHEVPIVVERDGRLVVVEGNRRVAALKAIQNPYLAPEHQSRIGRLAGDVADREALRYITVKKAPTQDDADQLIAALHTGNQRVAWTPARQAAFFQAQLDAGKTPEELIAGYPTIGVRKFIARSRILGLFRGVDYDDPELRDFADKRRFPVSTLARLYDNDNFLSLVGIKIGPEGDVSLGTPPSLFKLIATKIIGDIRENRINTRVLNRASSETYVAYMDELRDLVNEFDGDDPATDYASTGAPSSSPGAAGGFSSGSGAGAKGENPGLAPNSGSSGRKPATAKPKNRYLDLGSTSVPATFPASIHQIHSELGALRLDRFPNATLDLLRTFLEKSIKAYADSIGEEIKKKSQDRGFVYLSNCLVWLEEHFRSTKQTALVQPIQKIRGIKTGFVGTKEHLDATNHNHNIVATSDDVRETWTMMEPVIKAVLKS